MPKMGRAESWADAMREVGGDLALRDAMSLFRSLLGDGWSGWRSGAPLANRFHTGFQGRPPEGRRLADLIIALDGVPNLNLAVREGLASRSWEQFLAAVMALEVGGGLKRLGAEIKYVKNDHTPCPDLRFRARAREVVVELKALHGPGEEKDWDALYDLLFEMRHPFDVNDFDIDFAPPAIDFPDAVFEGLKHLGESTQAGWSDMPNGTGRARKRAEKHAWFRYPISQKSVPERISLKLKKWCRKFVENSEPTLIVVEVSNAFDFHRAPLLALQTLELEEAIQDSLAGKRMISGVLVYEKAFLPALPKRSNRVSDTFLFTGGRDGLGVVGAMVPNVDPRVPLRGGEVATVAKALIE